MTTPTITTPTITATVTIGRSGPHTTCPARRAGEKGGGGDVGREEGSWRSPSPRKFLQRNLSVLDFVWSNEKWLLGVGSEWIWWRVLGVLVFVPNS